MPPLNCPVAPAGRSTCLQRGTALVIMLAVLVISTVVVVALMTVAQQERSSASMVLQSAQAGILADTTMQMALGTINDAIAEGSQPGKTWASEPGRIWVFNIAPGTGEITRHSVDLLSALPAADPDNVDLNSPSLNGTFPIAAPAPGQTAANMKVGWDYILKDPSQPASKGNKVLGRIAYWVDDESCKVNINTANGSSRNATPADMAATGKYSFGFGTPSEISLAALPGLDQTKAAAIAEYPWQQEFNTAEEITRAKDAGGTQVVTRPMFEALRFDITHYNSSPDVNFMGEPRIELLFRPDDSASPFKNIHLGAYDKTQAQNGVGIQPWQGLPLDHLYPQAGQLPLPSYLPASKLFRHTFSAGNQLVKQTGAGISNDYYVGKMITNYLNASPLNANNSNLQGQTFNWPKFEGSDSSAFAGKYTPRQLDSITLQILDTVGKITFADQQRPYTFPGVLVNGWLSNEPVVGVARSLKLTEILVDVNASIGDPFSTGYVCPYFASTITLEMVFPEGFKGVPLNVPYENNMGAANSYDGGYSVPATHNFYDSPLVASTGPQKVIGNSQTGTMWMDYMLTALDQNGQSAGFDLAGNPRSHYVRDPVTGVLVEVLDEDPDQAKAGLFHPYCLMPNGKYCGSRPATSKIPGSPVPTPMLAFLNSNTPSSERAPGVYGAVTSRYAPIAYYGKPGTTSIHLKGGLNHWLRYSNNYGYVLPTFGPFDSALIAMAQGAPPANGIPVQLSASEKARVLETVIPIDMTIPVPGTRKLLIRTSDPLVSDFPKDWELVSNPTSADITIPSTLSGANRTAYYKKGGVGSLDPFFPPSSSVSGRPIDFDGSNIGLRPSNGGDPLSIWLPNQDIRIPKQARFPSVGALFSLRTGLFPDKSIASQPYSEQHGVPFRALNMSPSTQSSQRSSGGASYPDWAMLDLFNVPFLPQKPYMKGTTAQPFRRLTYGGATIGRININNPEVPYPFSEATPGVTQTPPKRNALKALFQGLSPSKSYDASGAPVYSPIDAAGSESLAKAISDYQATHGPFFMAGEIANVPAVANYLYTGVAAGSVSRNDLVRDTVGAITTRSNVFSVWVAAQTIKKAPFNTQFDTFERGDKVTSEVRRRYLVERFIETGKDGVPGNAVTPAQPDVPNAYTSLNRSGDTINTTYHPSLTYPLPYRWRVIAVENIQL